jgi:hypothetical protein
MNLSPYKTKDYDRNLSLLKMEKQSQTNPILPAYMAGEIALSLVEGPIVSKVKPAKPMTNFQSTIIVVFNSKISIPENFYCNTNIIL